MPEGWVCRRRWAASWRALAATFVVVAATGTVLALGDPGADRSAASSVRVAGPPVLRRRCWTAGRSKRATAADRRRTCLLVMPGAAGHGPGHPRPLVLVGLFGVVVLATLVGRSRQERCSPAALSRQWASLAAGGLGGDSAAMFQWPDRRSPVPAAAAGSPPSTSVTLGERLRHAGGPATARPLHPRRAASSGRCWRSPTRSPARSTSAR